MGHFRHLGKVLDGPTAERYARDNVEDQMHRTSWPIVLLAVPPITIATAVSTANQAAPSSEDWTVTKLTGQIIVKVTAPPDMPEGSCMEGETVFRASVEGSSIYGPLSPNEEFMGGEVPFGSVRDTIIAKFGTLPGGQTINVGRTGDVFVFRFAFDNGYHTNDPLLDTRQRALRLGSMLGAVSYYIGAWSGSDEVFGLVAAEGPHVQEDGGTTGLSAFEVNGQREGKGLAGEWQFREAASLMGCIQTSLGSGSWAAKAD